MGKMFGQHLESRLIKWKLGFLWNNSVKNKFYLDHYEKGWFALEFSDADDFDFVFSNRPWHVQGQVFHFERWMTHFSDMDAIGKLAL